jgi:hypothetical protein
MPPPVGRDVKTLGMILRLEHVPFGWNHLNDENMLHFIDLERFLIDHMVPCDRKALEVSRIASISGTILAPEAEMESAAI